MTLISDNYCFNADIVENCSLVSQTVGIVYRTRATTIDYVGTHKCLVDRKLCQHKYQKKTPWTLVVEMAPRRTEVAISSVFKYLIKCEATSCPKQLSTIKYN